MALTNEDIAKLSKTIKSIVRSEVGNETKNLKSSLTAEIKLSRMTIQLSISELENRIKNIELNQSSDHKLLLSMQKDIKKLNALLTQTTDFLDNDNLNTVKRVERVETYLHLPEFNFA